jgi:hypothetical protein
VSALTPIEKYLGLSAGRDPFSLLGLSPGQCEQRDVVMALSRRLALIDRHPHARSMEAEEVRLALHAAAAQLFDPIVRDHLIRATQQGQSAPQQAPPQMPASPTKPPPPSPGRPAAPSSRMAQDRVLKFQDAALRLIKISGGWNPRAAHRVAALAHAYGLEKDEVRAAFHVRRNGAARRVAPTSTLKGAEPPSEDVRDAQRALNRRRKGRDARTPLVLTIVALSIGGVFVVGMALLGAVLGPVERAAQIEASVTPEETASIPIQRPETPERIERTTPRTVVTASNLRQTLIDALRLRDADPGEAAWRVDEVVRWLRANWTSMTPGAREHAIEQTLAFMSAGGTGSAASQRVLNAIAGVGQTTPLLSGEKVTADVFAAGALAEASAAGDIPAEMRASARQLATMTLSGGAAGDSFESGASAALLHWGDRLTGSEAPTVAPEVSERLWRSWIAASVAIADEDHERRALDIAGRFLRIGPSPADDSGARRALLAILESVSWPADGSPSATAAADRVLAWFDDDAVSTEALAVVTEWLATSDVAAGVSFAMVLPRSAGPESRRGYRDRFARAWGQAQEAMGASLSDQWVSAAKDAVRSWPSGQSAIEAVALAVRMSRLSEAAQHRFVRRVPEAQLAMASAAHGVEFSGGRESGAGLRADSPASDGQWALAYLSAPGNATGRLRALDRLPPPDEPLGVIDAEVLAEAALWASPAEVRTRAAWLLLERTEHASVVSGVFEALPKAPRTQAASSLIESITGHALPAPESPDWSVEARRAVVARLLAMMAGQSPMGSLDALRDALAASYRERAGTSDADQGAGLGVGDIDLLGEDGAGGNAQDAAEALRRKWAFLAAQSPSPLPTVGGADEIERRRLARQRVAQSASQRFLAEQAAIVELMAVVIANERPEGMGRIQAILDDVAESFSAGRTVFLQMLRAEEAQLRLWAVRLSDPPPTPSENAAAMLPEGVGR